MSIRTRIAAAALVAAVLPVTPAHAITGGANAEAGDFPFVARIVGSGP